MLLDRHHAIVRKAIKRHRGKEIDTAGDGFFASFSDQVDAIRCACQISDDVTALGIEVRAGCHVGQAEVMGKKLGGVTVHVGARVMAEAGPSEVLVSSMLKDLVPASGFSFSDRGIHKLKNIDGDWHLYAVTGVDGAPRPARPDPEEAARLREEIKPPPLTERRSGRIGIGALALIVVAGAVIFVANRPHPIEVQPNSLVQIDPDTNGIVSDVAVQDPDGAQITFVPPTHEIWVLSQQDQVISVVDTRTHAVQPSAGRGWGSGACSKRVRDRVRLQASLGHGRARCPRAIRPEGSHRLAPPNPLPWGLPICARSGSRPRVGRDDVSGPGRRAQPEGPRCDGKRSGGGRHRHRGWQGFGLDLQLCQGQRRQGER